jgi:hypothetical protein
MRTVNQIAKEGTGVYIITRGDVGQIVKAAKAKKVEMISPWLRKKKGSK